MKCVKCGHETFYSTNTEAIELGNNHLLIIRNIPCYKCHACDEIYYTGDIVELLEKITDAARMQKQELSIVDFAEAA